MNDLHTILVFLCLAYIYCQKSIHVYTGLSVCMICIIIILLNKTVWDCIVPCTCNSGTKQAHDWVVEELVDLFRTTHRVKTQHVMLYNTFFSLLK